MHACEHFATQPHYRLGTGLRLEPAADARTCIIISGVGGTMTGYFFLPGVLPGTEPPPPAGAAGTSSELRGSSLGWSLMLAGAVGKSVREINCTVFTISVGFVTWARWVLMGERRRPKGSYTGSTRSEELPVAGMVSYGRQ